MTPEDALKIIRGAQACAELLAGWGFTRAEGLMAAEVLLQTCRKHAEPGEAEACSKSVALMNNVTRPAAVHVLAYGAALCGMAGVPGDWPEGHRWVGFLDLDWATHVTCDTCKAKANEVHQHP